MRSLSRSTAVMFLFDLFALPSISYLSFNYFMADSCSFEVKFTAIALIVIAGLFSLFLKGHYKIREFNITLNNILKLLEASIFANIPAIILLYFFASKTTLLKFSLINISAIFLCLLFYRLGFHYYLFNLKKIKKVLIVGANDRAKAIAEVIKNKYALRMEVVGIAETNNSSYKWTDKIKVFGHKIKILQFCN